MDTYYEQNFKVTRERIDCIEQDTREQSLNPKWFEDRKKELLAQFSEILYLEE